jgi:hypothetical protein
MKHAEAASLKRVRYAPRSIVCPTCKAEPGEQCKRRDGGERYSQHSTRYGAWFNRNI